MAGVIPARREIPVEYTWDVASVFASDEAWEAEIRSVRERLGQVDRFRGHLGDGPEVLADWLDFSERTQRSLGKIYVYASNLHAVDTADQEAAAKDSRVSSLYAQVMAALSFSEPELLSIGLETLRRWVKEEPRLAIYAHYLDELEARQAHLRSTEVEELLGQVSDPFRTASETHGVLADADLKFAPAQSAQGQTFEVGQGSIGALLNHADREVRRTAWESYADAHLAVKNTMANALLAGIKQDIFYARARRYPSALEAALAPNHIPVEVYYNVVNTFRKNLPIWHRYWRVRRKALGYDRLHVYDIKAPLTDRSPNVLFQQAADWISEGMQPLGQEYVDILQNGLLRQRWVDIYPNKGKRSGAFSTGVPGTYPFVLMSYVDDLYSLSTLAHELGHSLHSYYTWHTQPYVYADYSIFVAEVASNFNQALVRDYLFAKQPDPDFQIALIEEAMSNFHRYFFIMPTLARFELITHEMVEKGGSLTADGMIALMCDLFQEGYGQEVEIDRNRIGITWAEFHTHLYSNFYVYQYTTGIAAAQALEQRVQEGQPGAVEDYIAFLKAGSSRFPLDALKLAGIDMTTPAPIEEAFAYLGSLVDRLEGLAG